MARRLRITAAMVCVAALALAGFGCFGKGKDTGEKERREKQKLAGIFGTWTSKEGDYTVVLLADTSGGASTGGTISNIPGEVAGRVFIKQPAKDPKDPKATLTWKRGVYKVVDRYLVAGSATEELWGVTFTVDLNGGRLSMPTGTGKVVQMFRSAKPAVVKLEGGEGL